MVAFDFVVEKLKREESSEVSDDFVLRELTKLNQMISDTIWSYILAQKTVLLLFK